MSASAKHRASHRELSVRAYKLSKDGMTHRQIAAVVGKKPEIIKSMILLGERILSERGA